MDFNELFSFLVLCLTWQSHFSLAKIDESPEGEDFCRKYRDFRRTYGYLSAHDVKDYCRRGCNTLPKYACPEEVTEPAELSFSFEQKLLDLLDSVDQLNDEWLIKSIDEDSLSESFWFFLPWIYGLSYVLVASGAGNAAGIRRAPMGLINSLLVIGYGALFRGAGIWPFAFNVLLAVQSTFAGANYHIFNDVAAIGILIVALVFGTLMCRDLFVQLGFGVLILCCFVVIIYRKMVNSRREDVFNCLSLLLILKMCADYTQLLFDRLMIENPGTLLVRHIVYAMLPWEGRYISFLNNMNFSSAQLATLFVKEVPDTDHLYIFFFSMLVYALAFIGLRCGIGLIMLRKMHADFHLQLVWTGFYSYAIDVFNPFKIVFYSLLRRDSRMVWYALIMCAFNIGEFFTARDFLLMRCVLMVLDFLVIRSGLAGPHRFLEFEMDLGGLVFEKPGAFPYFFIDQLVDVQKYCKRVLTTVENTNDVFEKNGGVGLIRSGPTGPRLLTVMHVLDKKEHVEVVGVEGVSENVGHIEVLGDSVDPPVSMALRRQDLDGSLVRDISPSEVASIKYLFVVSPDGAICPILDWSISKGDILATVNLKAGDSGSPVCAVLSSGVCVVAGVVSRGDSREGNRNLLSAIKTQGRLSGSPGISGPYFEAEAHKISEHNFRKVMDAAYKCREVYALYGDNFPEFFENLDFHRNEHDPDPWVPDFERGPDWDERMEKKKRNVKNARKNRAVKKRQFLELLSMLELTDRSHKAIERFADGGPIVKFNACRRRSVSIPHLGYG